MSRIANKFADLKSKEQSAFVSYIMAGDPNYDTTLEIMKGLPEAGVDIIEIGAPLLTQWQMAQQFNWQDNAH